MDLLREKRVIIKGHLRGDSVHTGSVLLLNRSHLLGLLCFYCLSVVNREFYFIFFNFLSFYFFIWIRSHHYHLGGTALYQLGLLIFLGKNQQLVQILFEESVAYCICGRAAVFCLSFSLTERRLQAACKQCVSFLFLSANRNISHFLLGILGRIIQQIISCSKHCNN